MTFIFADRLITYQYLSLLRGSPIGQSILIFRSEIVNDQVILIRIKTMITHSKLSENIHQAAYLGKAMKVPLFLRVTSRIKVANRPVEYFDINPTAWIRANGSTEIRL